MASSPLVILSGQKSAIEVPEILAIIFHFLSNRDVQTSRLVCKAWSLTGNDAILARSKNLLQVVLVVSESITNATASVKKSKHSFVDGELLKHALELASRKAGLDSQAYGIQAEINALIQSHPIAHALAKTPATSTNLYLVPITLQCVDHHLSEDSRTLVRKFVPIQTSSDRTSTSRASIRNYSTTSGLRSHQTQSNATLFPSHEYPHFITENNFLNDSCILAFASVHTRRGNSGGIKFTLKCLTGSPSGSTSIFSRDTRSFLMEHGVAEMGRSNNNLKFLAPLSEDVLRDGYIGSLRDGCFGSDFVAYFGTRPWTQLPEPPAENSNRDQYEVFMVSEDGVLDTVPVPSTTSRRQSMFLNSLHLTDGWLCTKADPTCTPKPVPAFLVSSNPLISPLGSIYCRIKWKNLYEKCIIKGLDLERAGFTDKTLFYLRKYVFSSLEYRGAPIGQYPPGNSLLQALRLVMYVWADKLSHFLDHDFKNKMKQADIITKMHFEPDIMLAHLIKLRKAAVERFLDNPIGLKYLQVTGFTSELSNINALFAHLSLPEVHTTRSKAFHDKITRCVNMDTLEI